MWEKISGLILRYRKGLILFLVSVTLFMGYFAVQVELAYDNPKFVPDQDPDNLAYIEFKDQFGEDGNLMVIGINDPKIRELEFFQSWYDLTKDLEAVSGVKSVLSLANIKDVGKTTQMNVIGEDSFETTVFQQKEILSKRPETQEELDAHFDQLYRLKFYEGVLFNRESNFTMLALGIDKEILNTKKRIGFVNQLVKQIDNSCKPFGVEYHVSGLPYIRTQMARKVKNELIKFTLISVLVTSLILMFFFRSFRTLFMSLGVVNIGVIWSLGIIALFGYKISVFMSLLPPLIVVIGIANCIYLINRYHEEFRSHQNKIKSLQRVISKVGIAVFFTNLTTAVGFGVLILTGSKVLQEFGIVAFLSIMAIFVISIILIPVLSSFINPPQHKHVKHLDYKFLNKIIHFFSEMVLYNRKLIYTVTIILTVLSVFGIFKIKSLGYMLDDISSREKLYKDLKFFESNVKGIMPFEIVIDTKKTNGVENVSTLLNIDYLERRLMEFPEFSRSVSIAQIMKFLNQAYYEGDERRFRTPSLLDLGSITSSIPQDNKDLGASFIDRDKSKARISLQMADVGSRRIKEIRSDVENIADSIFNYKKENKEIFTDSILMIDVWDSANNIADTTYYSYFETNYIPVDSADRVEVSVTGTSVIFLKGNDYLISNLMISLLVAFILISLLMAAIFTSSRMIIISLVPNMLPLLFTAGIIGFGNVNFKPSTVLVFSVAFGIAVDFSIHFLTKYKMELKRSKNIRKAVAKVQSEISTSMIYTAVILFCGFIIFVGSGIGGTIALGLFTAITLMISLLSNLLLLPSLLISYDIAKSNKEKALIELDDI